jgi:DNA-binding MarR family transcriptional regulator
VLSAEYENLLAFRTSLRRFLHWSHSQAQAVGLTLAQHQLMVAVKGHPGGKDLAISDLAGYLLLRHHSAVELVGRAAAAGLVERYADAKDGRITRVRLTADGEARPGGTSPARHSERGDGGWAARQRLAGTADARRADRQWPRPRLGGQNGQA